MSESSKNEDEVKVQENSNNPSSSIDHPSNIQIRRSPRICNLPEENSTKNNCIKGGENKYQSSPSVGLGHSSYNTPRKRKGGNLVSNENVTSPIQIRRSPRICNLPVEAKLNDPDLSDFTHPQQVRKKRAVYSSENRTDISMSPEYQAKDKVVSPLHSIPHGSKRKSANSTEASKDTNLFRTQCRPKPFRQALSHLTEEQKCAVYQMGFGKLLEIQTNFLNKIMLKSVCLNIDCDSREIVFPNGTKVPITIEDVHYCLGLPCTGRVIESGSQKRIAKALSWDNLYTIFSPQVGNGVEFKRAFLQLACCSLLVPEKVPNGSSRMYQVISETLVHDCSKYNWCELVLSKLFSGIKEWKPRSDNTSAFMTGSLIFLQIFYMFKFHLTSIPGVINFSSLDSMTDAKVRQRINIEFQLYQSYGNGEIQKFQYQKFASDKIPEPAGNQNSEDKVEVLGTQLQLEVYKNNIEQNCTTIAEYIQKTIQDLNAANEFMKRKFDQRSTTVPTTSSSIFSRFKQQTLDKFIKRSTSSPLQPEKPLDNVVNTVSVDDDIRNTIHSEESPENIVEDNDPLSKNYDTKNFSDSKECSENIAQVLEHIREVGDVKDQITEPFDKENAVHFTDFTDGISEVKKDISKSHASYSIPETDQNCVEPNVLRKFEEVKKDIRDKLMKDFQPTIFDVPTIVDKVCFELSLNNLLPNFKTVVNTQLGSPNTMLSNDFKSDSPFINQNFCPKQTLSPSAFIVESVESRIQEKSSKVEEKVDIECILNPCASIEKLSDEELLQFFTQVDTMCKERLSNRKVPKVDGTDSNNPAVRSTSQVISHLLRKSDDENLASSKPSSCSSFQQCVGANTSVDICHSDTIRSSKLSLSRRAKEVSASIQNTHLTKSTSTHDQIPIETDNSSLLFDSFFRPSFDLGIDKGIKNMKPRRKIDPKKFRKCTWILDTKRCYLNRIKYRNINVYMDSNMWDFAHYIFWNIPEVIDDLLIRFRKSAISREFVHCFYKKQLVNNFVVDIFMSYWNEGNESKFGFVKERKSYYLPSIFGHNLYQTNSDVNLRTLTKIFGQVFVDEYQAIKQANVIFLPHCIDGHWSFHVLDMVAKRISCFDTFNTAERKGVNVVFLDKVKRIVSRLLKHYFEITGIDQYEFLDVPVLQQNNGEDCGVYMLKLMESWSPSFNFEDFSVLDVDFYRCELAVKLVCSVNNEIIGPVMAEYKTVAADK